MPLRLAQTEAITVQKAQEAAQAALETQRVTYTPPTPIYIPVAAGDAKMFIYMSESGNRPDAINATSGACGLGQALPCSKMPCNLVDYACQDSFFTQYMLGRYGNWEAARSFWLSHRWW